MRLRILELPARTLGEARETPFLVVFDRCSQQQYDMLLKAGDTLKSEVAGASAVLSFTDEIELG